MPALYKNPRVDWNNDSSGSNRKNGETCQKLDRLPNIRFRFFLFPVTRAVDVEGTDHRVSRIISAKEEVSDVAGVQGFGC